MNRFMRLFAVLFSATAFVVGAPAMAAYPERPITILVGFSPGGNVDTLARTLQPYLEKELGTKIVVQNMPGAGGSIAYQHLSEQKPDGYTAALNTAPSLLPPLHAGKRRYNLDSFTFISALTDEPYTVFVNHKKPRTKGFATIQEFVEHARANPGKVLVGGAAVGSGPHLAALQISRVAGVDLTWVPFKGSAPAVAALEGGHVDAVISSVSMGVKLHKEDRARTLALLQDNRWDQAGDIPAIKEAGWTVRAGSHRGLIMPAGVSDEIVAKVDGAVAKVFANPDFLADAKKRSMILAYADHAAYTSFIREADKMFADMWKSNPWLTN